MEINPDIKEILKEFRIDKNQGILCLLAIYYGLNPEKVISDEVIKAINLTKIIERYYPASSKNISIKWNIALFRGQETAFEWVKEWNDRWNVQLDRKAALSTVLKRMKDFFAKYPEYRKEDVIRATDFYFSTVNIGYLKNSAAFIFDGAGAMKNSILLGWCEKTKESKSSSTMKGTIIK